MREGVFFYFAPNEDPRSNERGGFFYFAPFDVSECVK